MYVEVVLTRVCSFLYNSASVFFVPVCLLRNVLDFTLCTCMVSLALLLFGVMVNLLYFAHLLALYVFVTKELLLILLGHGYASYTCSRPLWWVCAF